MSGETEDRKIDKQGLLFLRLILSLQTSALQYMGKLTDPVQGRPVRDLEQASASIDTLDMLRHKCRGNLSADEERLLNHIVSELKLNYIDEIGRPEPAQEASGEASEQSEKQQEREARP